MTKKVLKFGGTSVGSIQRIVHAAKLVKKEHDNGSKIIVVVSAMAGTTNNLIAHSQQISKKFNKRELDVLLTSGEQVSSALMAGALNDLGVKVALIPHTLSNTILSEYKLKQKVNIETDMVGKFIENFSGIIN